MYQTSTRLNLDFMRKLSWKLSRLYHKLSTFSHKNFNYLEALKYSEVAKEYFTNYKNLTKKISKHPILKRCNFLEDHQFLTRN